MWRSLVGAAINVLHAFSTGQRKRDVRCNLLLRNDKECVAHALSEAASKKILALSELAVTAGPGTKNTRTVQQAHGQ